MADSSETTLLIAVLSQIGGEVKLDFNKLAAATGSPTANAARVKWQRYRKKLEAKGGMGMGSPTKPTGNSPSKPTGVSKAAAKPKANNGNARTPTKKGAKQVKAEATDEEMGTEEDESIPMTPPSRQLPARKARTPVGQFKEESSEGEGDEIYEHQEPEQEEQDLKFQIAREMEDGGQMDVEGEGDELWE